MKKQEKSSVNKNRLEIRLDPDSQQLLDSLIVRTSLTKTSLIKKALIVYASTLARGHIYTVKYQEVKEIKDEFTEEELEEHIRIAKTPWLDDNED